MHPAPSRRFRHAEDTRCVEPSETGAVVGAHRFRGVNGSIEIDGETTVVHTHEPAAWRVIRPCRNLHQDVLADL